MGARQIKPHFSPAMIFTPVVEAEKPQNGTVTCEGDSPAYPREGPILIMQCFDEGLNFLHAVEHGAIILLHFPVAAKDEDVGRIG